MSPGTALRQILDRHADQISEELERLLAESRERERREFAELREQDRQEFTETLERTRRELAGLRERDREEFEQSLKNAQIELAGQRERDRQELAEAAERERQHQAELREQDHREFTESLANARQELADLRERDQQEFAAAQERGQREFADRLRQAVRRLRQSKDWDELAATLVDAAAAYCDGAAWLRVTEGVVRGGPVRGVATEAGEVFRALEIPLAKAAALAGAVESRDPVIAAIAEKELSAELLAVEGHPAEGRVAIFPLLTHSGVPGLLYTWGKGQEAVLEMLSEVASAGWEILTPAPPPPAPAAELVRIAPAQVPATVSDGAAPRSAWDDLSPDEQQIHLRAQRYARVQAAEMRLHEADAVETGRARRNLYELLRRPIDQARATFHQRFFVPCPSMVDYLHLELVRTLANDDAELLGKDYPGPLV